MTNKINVTKTFLPPRKEFDKYLDQIWESGWLTNQGPLLRNFEKVVAEYLNVEHFQFVTNGTLALQLALRGLDLTDCDIITTPFSYVATTSSILWEHNNPVFVDINKDDFCIDVNQIEQAITPNTKAILPVHVFGNPCNVEVIESLAKKHNLKIIYDAAHAFGVTYKGKSLLTHGDVSVCSFHATKIYHTIEGGGLVISDKKYAEKIHLQKKFGHHYDDHITLGINAKSSEFQAAMGLCNINYLDQNIEKRRKGHEHYDKLLSGIVQKQNINENVTSYNYAYYPVVLKNEKTVHRVLDKLAEKEIYPRRYFYPSLNTLSYISTKSSCPVSEDLASRILCLPLYEDIDVNIIKKISKVIINEQNQY